MRKVLYSLASLEHVCLKRNFCGSCGAVSEGFSGVGGCCVLLGEEEFKSLIMEPAFLGWEPAFVPN